MEKKPIENINIIFISWNLGVRVRDSHLPIESTQYMMIKYILNSLIF